MIKELLKKEYYKEEFNKLRIKAKENPKLLDKYNVNEAITLKWTLLNEDFIIKELIKTVRNKEYKNPIAKEKKVLTSSKERLLYSFDWPERVFQGVFNNVFNISIQKQFSSSLRSYRKGMGVHNTLIELSHHIENNKNDDIFILKRDIKSYGDSINHDLLFKIISEYIGDDNYFFDIAVKILKFYYYPFGSNELIQKQIGLPTGSPINNTITNLFLSDLDKVIDSFYPNCKYFRYGDDILVVTSNVEIASQVTNILNKYIENKKLTFNPDKILNFKFNKLENKHETFKYLGLMVDPISGNIYLTDEKEEKLKEHILDLINRIFTISKSFKLKDKESVLNITINVKKLFYKTDLYTLLSSYFPIIKDEEFWQKLDLWIARKILSKVYNISDDRVFKKYSFKELRAAGLPSIRHLRRLYLSGDYERLKDYKLL